MSKLSTIYPALITEVETIFTGKTRLHNPYTIEENPDLVRKNAWGIKVEDASKEDQEFCDLSLARQFTVVMLRQFVSLAGKENGFDAVTLALLEDQQSLAMLLHSPNEIGQEQIIDIINVTNISGIQELKTDEKKYLLCEVTFTITISELI